MTVVPSCIYVKDLYIVYLAQVLNAHTQTLSSCCLTLLFQSSEASVSLGQSLLDMYGESDDGRSVAAAFYATRTDTYTANIRFHKCELSLILTPNDDTYTLPSFRTGLVVGVLEGKLNKWRKELEEVRS